MNNLNGEKGAALVFTVMMVTLTIFLLTALMSQNVSTIHQVTTMEDEIDAQLIAEMGQDYFEKLIELDSSRMNEDKYNTYREDLTEFEGNGKTIKLDEDRELNIQAKIDVTTTNDEYLEEQNIVIKKISISDIHVTSQAFGAEFERSLGDIDSIMVVVEESG